MRSLFNFLNHKPIFWMSAGASLIGCAVLFRDTMQGEQFTKKTRADGKVFIVTGANAGIGKETVRELAKRGATIYMACRDMTKCQTARDEIVLESKNKYVYCRECDLASLASIKKFVETFKMEQKKLDVLINNAGVMRCPHMLTKDGFEMQLGVNHLGHFYLTNLLLDFLMKSAPSRIVVVSSIQHERGEINIGDINSETSYDENRAYSQSKLANILFTRELAQRLDGTGVTVNALHPGIVDTELFRHMSFFNNIFAKIFFKPLYWPFMKTPRSGAQTTLFAALDPELENVSGLYFSDCAVRDVAPAALDPTLAKWLWAVSEKWTKLQ